MRHIYIYLALISAITIFSAGCNTVTERVPEAQSELPESAHYQSGNSVDKTGPHDPIKEVTLERVFSNLELKRLTNLLHTPSHPDHIFVTSQSGQIHMLPNDPETTRSRIFLDLGNRVNTSNNEEGLLGLAFDPEYSTNGHFYVHYSADGPRRSVISRLSLSNDEAMQGDIETEVIILEISQPYGNHNGGQIAFGRDGYLYIGLGDGGAGGDPLGNGQNTNNLLGTILRIDVNNVSQNQGYEMPPDNPFLDTDGVRDEIWAYGFRNPWRFSFDRETNLLWVADVGQNKWEEINIVERGLNYGWNTMEGNHCFDSNQCVNENLQMPVAEYGRSEGCSITGGFVYRGDQIKWLNGVYIYGDFCSGKIWGLRVYQQTIQEHGLLVDSALNITSFGEDASGTIYVLSRNEGIYKIIDTK